MASELSVLISIVNCSQTVTGSGMVTIHRQPMALIASNDVL